jgi:hypothetical protein
MGNYKIMQEILHFEDGSSSHALVKVPNSELEEWDKTHDAHGRLLVQGVVVNTKTEGTESSQASV